MASRGIERTEFGDGAAHESFLRYRRYRWFKIAAAFSLFWILVYLASTCSRGPMAGRGSAIRWDDWHPPDRLAGVARHPQARDDAGALVAQGLDFGARLSRPFPHRHRDPPHRFPVRAQRPHFRLCADDAGDPLRHLRDRGLCDAAAGAFRQPLGNDRPADDRRDQRFRQADPDFGPAFVRRRQRDGGRLIGRGPIRQRRLAAALGQLSALRQHAGAAPDAGPARRGVGQGGGGDRPGRPAARKEGRGAAASARLHPPPRPSWKCGCSSTFH